jgi:uncharacterized protein
MLKVVLDTNIVVSALLKPDSLPEFVISLILEKKMTLCLSEPIFTEYQEVLARKKFISLNPKRVAQFLTRLKSQAKWFIPKISVDIIETDPEDNKFLECAQEAKADFLITGNTKHFPFPKFARTRIVSPSEFLAAVAKKLSI